jgi:hypothetical protein
VTILGSPRDPRAIERCERIGVSRCIFWLPPLPAEEVRPHLERTAESIKSFA